MWETTGGSALLGEDSLEAAVREIKEELGLVIDSSSAKLIGTTKRYYKGCPDILDVWIFESNVKLEDIKIQEEELSEVENMMSRFIDDNKYDWMIPFGTAFVSLDAFKKYYDGFPGVHYGCVFYPAGFFDVYLHDARKNRLNPQFVPIGRILPQSEYDERFTEENVEEMVQRYLDTDYKALYEDTLEELRKVQKVNADLILKVMSLEDKHETRMNRKVIQRYGVVIEK